MKKPMFLCVKNQSKINFMKFKNIVFQLVIFFFAQNLLAQGGMWLPMHLEKQNEKEMKSLGLKLDADDIYNLNKSSIKDAICQFDGGCTGEIISPKGLLLTNHHCGFDAIQSLSTLEKNFVDNGFWAKSMTEELPAEGVTAMFVSRMEDVTALALKDVGPNMSDAARQSQIDKNLASIKSQTKKLAHEQIEIKPFYAGNQYFMFVTVTYRDLRLVGAPPSSIGKFGADTDNWVWPRHTGDFSMFRIYAGKDNLPADFSSENVPFVPKHFLPISLDGVDEGDFTMVYGFPGRTDEYLPASAVKQIGEVLDPARVAVRDRVLKIMDGFMRTDPDVKISYVARQSSIANAWKKWLGEMQGLKKYHALEKKQAYETEFLSRVNSHPTWKPLYGNILPRLNAVQNAIEPYNLARDFYLETMVRNCEIMGQVSSLNSWINSFENNGPIAFSAKIPQVKSSLSAFYKDYRPAVDKAIFAAVAEIYSKNVREDWGAKSVKDEAEKHGGFAGLADFIFKNSVLAEKSRMLALLEKSGDEIARTLKNDPAVVFWRAANDGYVKNVQPKIQEFQPQINTLQREYMAAQMDVFSEKRFFPDANSTLRLTYGNIRPFHPRDGVTYDFQTYLDGVMEKYVPGDYEFDLPQKMINLYKSKDYGQYATADGRLPVAFIGTNHTTGGNSGSPALDARGNLIGLNFDRVWEGTMSDLNYDPAICRNIMVDARYVLFIVDKFAGATNLIEEMKLVKGQKKKKKKKCK